jgi:hypothetical protein
MKKLPVIALAMFFALGPTLALAQAGGGAGAGGAGAGAGGAGAGAGAGGSAGGAGGGAGGGDPARDHPKAGGTTVGTPQAGSSGNQHQQHQQSASSSAQPHKSPGRFTSARAYLCGFSDVIALGGRSSGVGYISEAPVPLRGLFDVSDGRALFRGRTRSFRFARRMG